MISTGLIEPVDIVLDPVTQEIYWCDMRTFKIGEENCFKTLVVTPQLRVVVTCITNAISH